MFKGKVAGPTPLSPKVEKQEEQPAALPFEHQETAYLAVMNPETKKYDMLIIKIDLRTDETRVEREATRYDSVHRSLQDTIKRITDKMIKGAK
jgi:hypothetical protein